MSLSTIVFILVIALILFGPEDLPVIARTLGKLIYQVRKAADELTKEFQDAVDTPKNTLKRTIDEMTDSSSKKVKIDHSEWKQEPNKENNKAIDLLSYEEDEMYNTIPEEKAKSNPLSGLPENILTYESQKDEQK